MDIQRILVMDIGTASIKVFIADIHQQDITIHDHGSVVSQAFKKGEISDALSLGASIRQAVECTKSSEDDKIDAVIVGIGGMQISSQFALGGITIKNGYVSKTDITQVNNAAVLSAATAELEVLHMIPKHYRLDGCVCEKIPLGKSASVLECECSLITVSKGTLEELKSAMQAAEIKVDYFVANIFAIHELMEPAVEEDSYILMDLGAGTVDFIVYEHRNFVKAGSLPIGGCYISQDLMQGTLLDAEHAEKLKCYFGKLDPALRGQNIILDCSDENMQDKNVQYDFIYDIIDSRVNELVNIIYEALSIDLIDRDIKSIYLTGGSSLLYNFTNCLQAKFDMEVKPLDIKAVPAEYRTPSNLALYGMVQYARQRLVESGVVHRVEITEEPEYPSVFSKIKKLLRL